MLSHIQYKEIDILFLSYLDCKSEQDTIEAINEAADEVRKAKEPNSIYLLVDITGVAIRPEFLATAKRLNADVFDKKVKAYAIVGIDSAVRNVLLSVYNQVANHKLLPFETKEEALEYLYQASE